jgi:transposase
VAFIRKIKRNGRTYLAEVENQRVAGKIKQRFIRYLGPESETEEVFPHYESQAQPSDVKVYGSVLALHSITSQLGLYALFGEHAYAIMTLVFCHCHNYKSVSDTYKWFKKTDLSYLFGVEKISEKQLRSALEYLDTLDQFELQKSIFEMASHICEDKPTSVIYDVTNIHFEGIHCDLAKPGKDKEGVRGRRLVQIGLIVTKKWGLPIFHQVHPGNIHDSKIFKEAIVLLRRRGIRGGVIVHDRGITSKSNILELTGGRWKIVAGVPLHQGIKSAISNLDFSLIKVFRNLIRQGRTHFYATTIPFKLGEVNGKLIVLLNPARRALVQRKRLDRILDVQSELLKKKEIEMSLKKFFSKSGKVNTHALNRNEKYDGISILFTNGKISNKESVRLYFEKDIIEKSFQALRGIINIRPVHLRLDGKVNAHILICYLSYTLLTTFRCFLQKNRGKIGVLECSALQAFEEIAQTYKVYYNTDLSSQDLNNKNKQKYQIVSMTLLQEQILKAVCQGEFCSGQNLGKT